MNVVTNGHYRDIDSYLSRSPKITMNSVNCLKKVNSDSYSHFNVALLLYNYWMIEVYLLFEFNKLIQQFWICSARQLHIL